MFPFNNKAGERTVRDADMQPITAPDERWQHGQEATGSDRRGNPTGAVSRGVAALHKSGDIGDAEAVAAERFYADYVFGVLGARDPERVPGANTQSDAHTGALARTRAVTAHRTVTALLGLPMTSRLVAFLVDDLSYSAMAARFMPDRERADGAKRLAGQMVGLLWCLAGCYMTLDKQRPGRRQL